MTWKRDHLLRAIRAIVNEALPALEREFTALYSPIGRPSIPPEELLRPAAAAPRSTGEQPGTVATPSASLRKRIKEAFGWIKMVAGQEKISFRGRDRVGWAFTFAAPLQSGAIAQSHSAHR